MRKIETTESTESTENAGPKQKSKSIQDQYRYIILAISSLVLVYSHLHLLIS